MTTTATIRMARTEDPTPNTFGARLRSAFAMFRNAKSITGLAILGFFVLIAIFAAFLALRFIAGMVKFAVIAVIVLAVIYFLSQGSI